MSLEQELKETREAIDELNTHIAMFNAHIKNAAVRPGITVPEEAVQEEAVQEEAVEEAVQEEAVQEEAVQEEAVQEPEYKIEDIRRALGDFSKANGKASTFKLLARWNATNASSVKPDDYIEFMADVASCTRSSKAA